MNSLIRSILFLVITASSLAYSEPSRTLELSDSLVPARVYEANQWAAGLEGEPRAFCMDAERGVWVVVLGEPVTVRLPRLGGEEGSIEVTANVLELELDSLSLRDAHLAEAPEGAESIDPVAIVRQPFDGGYLVMDRESGKVLQYNYLPDEAVVIVEEAVRMVEVITPQEAIEVEEEYEIEVEVEHPAGILDGVAEVEVTSAGDEGGDEAAAHFEAVLNDDETLESVGEDGLSQGAVAEVLEDDVGVQESVILKRKAVRRVWVTPEPKVEYVEESYPVEKTVVVRRKFGSPVFSYGMDELGLARIMDLVHDTFADEIGVLGFDEKGVLLWSPVGMQDGSLVSSGSGLIAFSSAHVEVSSAVVDPVSGHWMISMGNRIVEYTRDGRMLKTFEHGTFDRIRDTAFRAVRLQNGTIERADLWSVTSSGLASYLWSRANDRRVLRVPGMFPTIRAAMDVATPESWILVSPGVYEESVRVSGRAYQVVSCFHLNRDPYFLEKTVITARNEPGVAVDFKSGSGLYLSGFRISGADVGILSSGELTVEFCEIVNNRVGMRLSGAQSFVRRTWVGNNTEDGIHYGDAAASMVEHCRITENGRSGIAVAITPFDRRGVFFTIIRRNDVRGNGRSGILFLDSPITTSRDFRIENNFFVGNAVAGVEVHLDQPDPQNPLDLGPRTPGPVYVVNNTFVDNDYGLLRGGNLHLYNNIISQSKTAGVHRVRLHSIITRNLFWENTAHAVESNYDASNNLEYDPMFAGEGYTLSLRSKARRGGVSGRIWMDDSDPTQVGLGASR